MSNDYSTVHNTKEKLTGNTKEKLGKLLNDPGLERQGQHQYNMAVEDAKFYEESKLRPSTVPGEEYQPRSENEPHPGQVSRVGQQTQGLGERAKGSATKATGYAFNDDDMKHSGEQTRQHGIRRMSNPAGHTRSQHEMPQQNLEPDPSEQS
ncbi:hypothetical protein LPJ78_001668 [Coemansia sp. RSA 989]|nr:hypothetical protein BX667DRAFT_174733 [Coemansia mojavensis]KAJ1866609.1 hypothetical protein LPJ78_001668 [Coemansia sp. RSA 989]KAJ1871015.1 hypothetical protein LPJ55_004217 [Coemansia sp. RSA 990]KAJ2670351.1 hypothetical protein IWW42_004053 [Coemansia sp. RSA 1085]